MRFIKNFFSIKAPEFDIEKAVGQYLIELPRCSGNVKIISQKTNAPCYNCDVIARADKLLSLAEEGEKAVWTSHNEEQAARVALPIWLRGADLSDQSVTDLPFWMCAIASNYSPTLIEEGHADVFCFSCNAYVANIHFINTDRMESGPWMSWKFKWICPQGHELHNMRHDIKIC